MKGTLGALRAEVETRDGVLHPRYDLELDGVAAALDPTAPTGVRLRYIGGAVCSACGTSLAPQRPRGSAYCFRCFRTLARNDLCVMAPHRCHLHAGTCREPEWADGFCMQPHTVYLALTSGLKVGVTRQVRAERRWLDQGAWLALPIAETPTRRAAGFVEHRLAERVPDRTDWRKLVGTEPGPQTLRDGQRVLVETAEDLRAWVGELVSLAPAWVPPEEAAAMAWLPATDTVAFAYPVQMRAPPRRIRVSAERPEFAGNLCGVLGRYLLFPQGVVYVDDHLQGDIEVTVGEALTPNEQSPAETGGQLSLFDQN